MRWTKKVLEALLIVLLTSVVGILSEDWIKPFFKATSIYADVYVSEWQPYPTNGNPDPVNAMKGSGFSSWQITELNEEKLLNFTKIIVHNTGFKEAPDVTIQLGEGLTSTWATDVVIVPLKGKRQFIPAASDITLPPIPAGKSVNIYLWHKTGLISDDYHFRRLRAFTPNNQIPIHFHHYENYQTEMEDAPWIIQFMENWIFVIFSGSLILVAVITGIVSLVSESYYKQLLKDDNFYLNEKIKFDSGKPFQPDLSFLSKK